MEFGDFTSLSENEIEYVNNILHSSAQGFENKDKPEVFLKNL